MGAFYCNSYQSVTTTSVTVSTETTTTENGTTATKAPTSANESLTESTDPDTTTSVTDASITTSVTDPSVASSVTTKKTGTEEAYADEISYPSSSTVPYSSGCHSLFTNFVKKHAVDIGAVGISLAVIQVRKYCNIT